MKCSVNVYHGNVFSGGLKCGCSGVVVMKMGEMLVVMMWSGCTGGRRRWWVKKGEGGGGEEEGGRE